MLGTLLTALRSGRSPIALGGTSDDRFDAALADLRRLEMAAMRRVAAMSDQERTTLAQEIEATIEALPEPQRRMVEEIRHRQALRDRLVPRSLGTDTVDIISSIAQGAAAIGTVVLSFKALDEQTKARKEQAKAQKAQISLEEERLRQEMALRAQALQMQSPQAAASGVGPGGIDQNILIIGGIGAAALLMIVMMRK